MADPAPAPPALWGLKPWHLIGFGITLIGFVGGMYMLTQLDDYRVGELEEDVTALGHEITVLRATLHGEIKGLEVYVAALERRERGYLERLVVAETKLELK